MKLTRCIQKNLKILARSKGSALIVLLAPLIIVFIIGLGFMDNTEVKLNIGVHVKAPNELTERYINSFNTTDSNLIIYEQELQCINSIRDGITVMCIIFSEDFEIRDDAKNELTFHVDESRINLVDKLTSSFSTSLGTESSEISQELANKLIQILETADEEAKESLALSITNKAQTNTAVTETGTAKTTLTGIDTTKETINTNTIETKISDVESDYKELKDKAEDTLTKAQNVLGELGASTNKTQLETSLNNLEEILNSSTALTNLDDLENAIKAVSTSVTKLSERIEKVGTAKTTITSNLNNIQTALETLTKNTEDIKTKQEKIIQEIDAFELRSAKSITNPVNTKIESVNAPNNRLTYSFSYLLTLAILFIGLMLSSTLVFMEKDSKAFFRNFTTPTTQKYFTFINYLTSLLIILIQTILILAIAHFTLSVPIITNMAVTATFLFIGITFFVTLGLLIGTLSTTAEAVTMSTIVLGSVFMFLSNLILPLETLSPTISKIANYNPYVIMSEGIRKAMLFQANFQQTHEQILILSIYTIIVIIIMTIINKLGLKHYLSTRRHKKNLLITEPEHFLLEIKEEKTKIKNILELIQILKTLKEEEYTPIKKDNQITDWLKNNLRKKALARKIKNKNLEKTIHILEKYQKKKDKKK